MKAIICGVRGNIEIYSPGTGEWRRCPCGGSAAKWDDPAAGRLAVAATDRLKVRGLGLVNTVIYQAFELYGQVWEEFRAWHDAATDLDGYVFHRDKAACWAVPFIVGSTTDTRWATPDEYLEAIGS